MKIDCEKLENLIDNTGKRTKEFDEIFNGLITMFFITHEIDKKYIAPRTRRCQNNWKYVFFNTLSFQRENRVKPTEIDALFIVHGNGEVELTYKNFRNSKKRLFDNEINAINKWYLSMIDNFINHGFLVKE